MKLVLLGLPGSGKSFYGKKLAEKLGFSFYDDDVELEKKFKLNTVQILEKYGDEEFLKMEEEVFRKGVLKNNVVISPGGSIVYSEDLMSEIKNAVKFIYLDQDFETILKRVKDEPRGIVYLKKYKNNYKKLFSDRVELYKKYANFTVDLKNDEAQVLEEICKFLSIHK